jgi:hypothetical protein
MKRIFATLAFLGVLAMLAHCNGQALLVGGASDAAATDGTGTGPGDGVDDAQGGPDAPAQAPCDPTSCPTGCCDATGTCVRGNTSRACGRGGERCVDCLSTGLACATGIGDAGQGGVCASATAATCTPANCAGCCEGTTCRDGSALTACGKGSAACVACPLGAACVGGACVDQLSTCGPANCVGCCIGTTCMVGTDQTACGQLGDKCQNCTGNGGCHQTGPLGGGKCGSAGCGGNCASGCCDRFLECLPGTDNLACGGGGNQCEVCSGGGACAGHGCPLGGCSIDNCSGCCDAFGVCHETSDLSNCGTDGFRCIACPRGYACNGSCVPAPACDASSCPTGCCDQNGLCRNGQSNAACGIGGVTCVTCAGASQCLQNKCQ